MYGCESWSIKEGWVLKNWCFWIVMPVKALESTLDCKEIKPINPKGNQPWIFIGKTDAEAPILWPSDVKRWLIGKDPDAGKDWRQEEKGSTEDEMVGWHHWLNGHEFEQTPGDSEGQGSLVCCSPWVHKESDTTEQLSKNSFEDRKPLDLNSPDGGILKMLFLCSCIGKMEGEQVEIRLKGLKSLGR